MEQRKKNILFVAGDLDFGGAQMHLVELVNHFRPDIQATVVVLSEKDALVKKLKKGVDFFKAVRRWRFDIRPSEFIAKQIAEKEYGYFFAENLFAFFFLALARKKSKKNFSITTVVHNTRSVSYLDFLRAIMFSRSRLPQDLFISVCRAQAEYFSKHYNIPAEQFRTIYNGVDTNLFTPRPSTFNAKELLGLLNISRESKVILQVATLRREKAHHYSIQALKILHSKGEIKPYLLFVGGGNDPLERTLKDLAKEAGLENYIKFCGMQNNIRPYYWISNVFTLSSIAVETFSISALEAMSSGLPCVLTDLGGAREMISDGINGFVVPTHSPGALAEGWQKALDGALAMNKNEIRKMVEEKFSMNLMVRSFESLIH